MKFLQKNVTSFDIFLSFLGATTCNSKRKSLKKTDWGPDLDIFGLDILHKKHNQILLVEQKTKVLWF